MSFENLAAVEMALVIEVVADGGKDSGELVRGLDMCERRYRFLPPCKRLV